MTEKPKRCTQVVSRVANLIYALSGGPSDRETGAYVQEHRREDAGSVEGQVWWKQSTEGGGFYCETQGQEGYH